MNGNDPDPAGVCKVDGDDGERVGCSAAAVAELVVNGGAGDDRLVRNREQTLTVTLSGGPGDDTIEAGTGSGALGFTDPGRSRCATSARRGSGCAASGRA